MLTDGGPAESREGPSGDSVCGRGTSNPSKSTPHAQPFDTPAAATGDSESLLSQVSGHGPGLGQTPGRCWGGGGGGGWGAREGGGRSLTTNAS